MVHTYVHDARMHLDVEECVWGGLVGCSKGFYLPWSTFTESFNADSYGIHTAPERSCVCTLKIPNTGDMVHNKKITLFGRLHGGG